jgi:hypothetical protein
MSNDTRKPVVDTGDTNPRRAVMGLTLIAGTCAAALPVLAVIVLMLSRSPHLDHGLPEPQALALATWLTLAAGALWGLVELAQPGASRGAWKFLLAAPLLLVGGIAVELTRTPPSAWLPRLLGANPAACYVLLVMFSMPILTSLFYILRSMTFVAPNTVGAFAGALSGSVASALYIWHCPENSLLYFAAWQGLAVISVAAFAAALGGRYLRRPAI